MTTLGVDVARGGADSTVISPRYGNWFAEQVVVPGAATPDGDAVASLVAKSRRDGAPVHIDSTGVGVSPFDTLRRRRVQVIAFVAAGKSTVREQSGRLGFANKQAESWWLMREILDPDSGQEIALPPDRLLRADLASARYSETPRGILIEPKNKIIERIGRSPDRGDAVVLARYNFRKVRSQFAGKTFQANTEFSVFD